MLFRSYAADQIVPWVDFVKGQRKDDIMHEHLAQFEADGRDDGVLFIGRAQEQTNLFRPEKRRNPEGVAYPWLVQTTALVHHFYVYAVDAHSEPYLLEFCPPFPYHPTLSPPGH